MYILISLLLHNDQDPVFFVQHLIKTNHGIGFHKKSDYSKTCLKRPLKKKTKIGFPDLSLLNAGQKYCRMLLGKHSAMLLTFIKLPFVFKTFVLSILSGCLRQV